MRVVLCPISSPMLFRSAALACGERLAELGPRSSTRYAFPDAWRTSMIAGARHLVALMVFLGLAGVADAQTFERDTDRPGGDLYSSTTAAHVEKPADCQLLCNRELGCRAWTWVRPGVQGPTARCWIKSSITPAVRGICCTSGTKKSLAPRDWGPDDIVSDVDLPGSDYQHFQVGGATRPPRSGSAGTHARRIPNAERGPTSVPESRETERCAG